MQCALVTTLVLTLAAATISTAAPRLLVMTDIGGDPDDSQSMVRLLVHADEFNIEGLIASASGTPGELQNAVTRADLIGERVAAYSKVLPMLRKHDARFPDVDALLSVIKSGNKNRGLDFIGQGCDTEGSDFIISVVDRDTPQPVNIAPYTRRRGNIHVRYIPDPTLLCAHGKHAFYRIYKRVQAEYFLFYTHMTGFNL